MGYVEGLQDVVAGAGWAAPMLFVVGYVVLTVALVPGSAMTALAGLLFGPVAGTALVIVAATAGATVAFWVARRLGRDRLQRLLGPRLARADRWVQRRGFRAMLGLRLVPLVPFNVLNYAAGLSRVRARDFVAATALGIVPGTFAYASVGGSVDDPLSPRFLAAVALVVALSVSGAWAKRFTDRTRTPVRAVGSSVASEAGADGEQDDWRCQEQQGKR